MTFYRLPHFITKIECWTHLNHRYKILSSKRSMSHQYMFILSLYWKLLLSLLEFFFQIWFFVKFWRLIVSEFVYIVVIYFLAIHWKLFGFCRRMCKISDFIFILSFLLFFSPFGNTFTPSFWSHFNGWR